MKKLMTTCIVGAALAGLSGCGNKLPEAASADTGRQALTIALDTWVKGGSAEELQNHRPAIYFNEPEWKAGKRLVRYQIKGDLEPFGRQLRGTVLLALQEKGGPTKEITIPYQIDTHEVVVIAREF